MTFEAPFERITIEGDKMGGKPCVRGLRITVEQVLDLLATYPSRTQILSDYPDLEEEDLRQSLAFARANLADTTFHGYVA